MLVKVICGILACVLLVFGGLLQIVVGDTAPEPGSAEAVLRGQYLHELQGGSNLYSRLLVKIAANEMDSDSNIPGVGRKYSKYFKHSLQNWGSDFVYYCADLCGYVEGTKNATGTSIFGAPAAMPADAWNHLIAAGAEYFTVWDAQQPRPGDIIFYATGAGRAPQAVTKTGYDGICHVGIVERVTSKYAITVLQSNMPVEYDDPAASQIARYVWSDTRQELWDSVYVYGYVRPDYPSSTLQIDEGVYDMRYSDAATGLYMNYYLFVPDAATVGMPLVVYLHGDSEDAQNNGMIEGTKQIYGRDYPFIAIAPCAGAGSWADAAAADRLKALVDSAVKEYSIDRQRIIITGTDQGAIGVWNMVSLYGDFFAAAMPVNRTGSVSPNIENCAAVTIYALIGNEGMQEQGGLASMQRLITQINKAGGNAQLTTLMAASAYSRKYFAAYLDAYFRRVQDAENYIDYSKYYDPLTKNNLDLCQWAVAAYESGWGYVTGTYGRVLRLQTFESKLDQYPKQIGQYTEFILSNWLNKRTADCVGLIKGYCWFDPLNQTMGYAVNGMRDISDEAMIDWCEEKGEMDTMPEIPGLIVWKPGHVGIYIGDGYVIQAAGTKSGVIKTRLKGQWTMWGKLPCLTYIEETPSMPWG